MSNEDWSFCHSPESIIVFDNYRLEYICNLVHLLVKSVSLVEEGDATPCLRMFTNNIPSLSGGVVECVVNYPLFEG